MTPRDAAKFAHLAYADFHAIETTVRGWGYDTFVPLDNGGTQGFICSDGEKAVVAFRGTEPGNLRDWITDLDARKTRLRILKGDHRMCAGYVHAGFINAFDNVRTALWNFIDTGAKSIRFVGHSLGGAISTLAARATVGLYGKGMVASNTTFGSPRTADAEFAKEYDALLGDVTTRIVNNNDLIPRLPIRGDFLKWIPWAKLQAFLRTTGAFGWRHVGKLKYISSQGQILDNPSKLFTFCDGLRGRWDDFGVLGTDGLKDHSIDRYKAAFKNATAS